MAELEDEVQRADPATRRRALLYIVVMTLIGVVAIGVVEQWLDQLRQEAAEDPGAAADEAARILMIFGAVISASVFGMALVIGRLSWRIFSADRFPPHGALLTVDTRVVVGAGARRRAYAGFVLASIVAALAVLLPYLLWRLLYTLTSSHP
jgi:hypothetical protein